MDQVISNYLITLKINDIVIINLRRYDISYSEMEVHSRTKAKSSMFSLWHLQLVLLWI